jgi:ribosomal protein S18 acetylase RimI-like enzyme
MTLPLIDPHRMTLPGEPAQCARLMSTMDPWLTLQRSYDDCLAAVQAPSKEVYVVTEGDAVVAFVILDLHGLLRGYLQTVCVAPSHQRRGLGTALISWAEEYMGRRSPNVFLCVSAFNQDAKRLYERLGYEVVGTLRDYFVTGYDEILMRKSRGAWATFRAR